MKVRSTPARAFAILALLGCCAQAQPSPPNLLVNPDFESGEIGKIPPGWNVGTGLTSNGGRAAVTGLSPANGSQCLGLELPAGTIAGFAQILDAVPLRGKRIRFRMAIRTGDDFSAGEVRLALEFDRQSPAAHVVVDDMSDRPVRCQDWTYHEIVGDVDPNATRVLVICRLSVRPSAAGQAWLDHASVEVLGDTPPMPDPEAPRPLTAQGLVNVAAFTRMLGYVRYFHPSDEAAATPWEPFTIEGLRAIENAANTDELATRLNELFGPIAPLVRVERTPPRESPALRPTGAKTLIAWRHVGIGTGGNNAYSSQRIAEAIPPEDSPRARELRPFVAEFSPGLWIYLPLAVTADERGTLPHAAVRPQPRLPEPTRSVATARDRATRLAAVATAWNVVQHSYPYFDVIPTDWLAELNRTLQRAAIDQDQRAFLITLRRLITTLHDGHGSVALAGFYGEAGMAIPGFRAEWIENELVITRMVTAAARDAGLTPGDRILSVDGRPIADLLAEAEGEVPAATRQFLLAYSTEYIFSGVRGTAMEVEFESFGKPGARTAKLPRDSTLREVGQRRTEKLAEIEPGIFYIDLDRVASAEFVAALPKLAKARGLVFDLRGYPNVGEDELFGHLSRTPIDMQPGFKPHLVRPDRTGINYVGRPSWDVQPQEPYLTAKRVFITNGRAVSYAESCMGIVEHYKLAAIVGEPTGGTNGEATRMGLPAGYSFSWTGTKVTNFDGSQFHGVGVQPTIPCEPTRAGVAAGRDELLERAIQAVKAE